MKRAIAICIVILLFLTAAGCNEQDTTADVSDVSSVAAPIEADLDTCEPRDDVDVLLTLQNSGTVAMYTRSEDVANARLTDDEQARLDFFKKYYGLAIQYRYVDGDLLTRFVTDFAAGDAPDYLPLDERTWPRAGLRRAVCSLYELDGHGVLALDHPSINAYKNVAALFTCRGEVYSVGIVCAAPALCAVNADLFARYGVKSPLAYYAEGHWDIDAYLACAKGLARTLADGTNVWGGCWADGSDFLVANGVGLVGWQDDGTLAPTLDSPACRRVLTAWVQTFREGLAPTAAQGGAALFAQGRMGMLVCDADTLARQVGDLAFSWDYVPAPLGDGNDAGTIPGRCVGNGIVATAKNIQGAVNYCIAEKQYRWYVENPKNYPYIYRLDSYKGVFTEEQILAISYSVEKIGLDLHQGTVKTRADFAVFWDTLSESDRAVEDVLTEYAPLLREAVDDANAAA